MPSRRSAINMSEPELARFLDEERVLTCATIGPGGRPHLMPLWYVRDGKSLVVWTYGKSQKIINLRRDPRLSVLVATGEVYEQLKGVSIQGQAEIVDDPDDVLRYGEAVYERYWGPLNDTVREGVQAMGAKRVVIVVKPEKILSWDHSKLGGAY